MCILCDALYRLISGVDKIGATGVPLKSAVTGESSKRGVPAFCASIDWPQNQSTTRTCAIRIGMLALMKFRFYQPRPIDGKI